MEEKEREKIKCKKCGSTQTYYRLKTNERYCRTCGFIEKLENKKEIKNYGNT